MAKYRILSIDGGGVRGLLVSVLLEELDSRVPRWRDKIDLVAGTSTGGIIALGLAKGLEPSRLRELYYEKSPEIFDSAWYELRESLPIVRAKYSNEDLREELTAVLGDTQLRHLKKRVLVASFDLADEAKGHWKPKFFHNYPGKDTDGGLRAVDVALYTSAAPTYFPSVDGFVDGAIVANNPSMAALAQTQDGRARIPDRPALDDIALLSIGTGFLPRKIGGLDQDWGYTQWARPILRVMFDGLAGVPHYQCSQILGKRYHRVDHALDEGIEMDDWKARDELVRIGEIEMKPQLDDAARWLDRQW
jgi:patatin-like phospholipase/acyl hydrolase